jgi:hypothetical protein
VTCRAARRLRRLIPLFAGGDLKASSLDAVANHVAACAACRAEVDAFAAVRSLLPLSSLSFSEEERAAVRRRVLDEISRRRAIPSPFAAFRLQPRFALAALAGIVVLGASLLAPLLDRNAVDQTAVLPDRPAPVTTPAPAAEHVAEAASPLPDRLRPASRVSREKSVARPPARTAEESQEPRPAVRFEIQTGNVNVRIIWFGGRNSAGEASSGPAGDKNGVS